MYLFSNKIILRLVLFIDFQEKPKVFKTPLEGPSQ